MENGTTITTWSLIILSFHLMLSSKSSKVQDQKQLMIETLNVVSSNDNDRSCDRMTRDGDLLTVNYIGKLDNLDNGIIFDSSGDEPFVFQLGRRQVIAGLDRGLLDMCVGDLRLLTIPPSLAYGDAGSSDGLIPPDSKLVFQVELLNIGDPPSSINVFRLIDHDRDGQLSRQEIGDYLRRQIPGAVAAAAEIESEILTDPDSDQLLDQFNSWSFDQIKIVDEIFQHEDRDKNGFISHHEFSGPKHDEL